MSATTAALRDLLEAAAQLSTNPEPVVARGAERIVAIADEMLLLSDPDYDRYLLTDENGMRGRGPVGRST